MGERADEFRTRLLDYVDPGEATAAFNWMMLDDCVESAGVWRSDAMRCDTYQGTVSGSDPIWVHRCEVCSVHLVNHPNMTIEWDSGAET